MSAPIVGSAALAHGSGLAMAALASARSPEDRPRARPVPFGRHDLRSIAIGQPRLDPAPPRPIDEPFVGDV